jgi:hypothetical protein
VKIGDGVVLPIAPHRYVDELDTILFEHLWQRDRGALPAPMVGLLDAIDAKQDVEDEEEER